jgi:AraC-like DNA-binding protein
MGRHSRAFDEHFQLLTGYTLEYYIKQRQLNHAAKALLTQPKRLITDIALEYQFSDHSAFSRAIKDKYGVTPNEIRKEGLWCFEERICFDDFTGKKNDTAVAQLLRSMELDAPWDVEYMLAIERLNDEYGFDVDTCYQIADLAERLEVPLEILGQHCFDAVADVKSDPNFGKYDIPPEVEFMLRANLEQDEMDAMCEHFKCEYYELDDLKIYKYRKLMNQQK